MSATRQVTVWCDDCIAGEPSLTAFDQGIAAHIEFDVSNFTAARALAALEWWTRRGRADVCPGHSPAYAAAILKEAEA